MSSAICTLFEGHYHLGLVGLTNSLYKQGFRGSIYAGYKGKLPEWADSAVENTSIKWEGSKKFQVAEGLEIHFLPLDTSYHLTNYKPDFMLRLWNGPAAGADGMFYFDPDIVITQPWGLFDEWISCGVAVIEDVNSPLSKFHPRRVAWRRYFGKEGVLLQHKNDIYVNGGFIGVSIENLGFLETWKKMQEIMASFIGGLGTSIFGTDNLRPLEIAGGPFMPFYKTDQDALNAAIEACDNDISFIGKEGMGFDNGFVMMYHALGVPKPWKWKPFRQSLDGRPPRKVDIEYWSVLGGPIRILPQRTISMQKLALKITTGIGRFYKRN